MIENKRMGKEVSRIIPETISEDFIIRTLSADSVVADIHSSDLFLQRVQVTDEGKNGKKLVFHYKGFRHQEVDWQVDMVLTLEEGKHYMRKYLEITVPDSQRHLAHLDYIDFEPMSLPEGYAVWTHPVMEQGVGGVSGYYISWGNRCTYRACSSDLNSRLRRRRLRVIGKYVSAIIRERALRCLLRKAVWRTAGRLPPGKK